MDPIIKNWNKRLTHAQTGHYITSERYITINRLIGIPLVVFSTFVSAFLFFERNDPIEHFSVLMKVLGILVALLASLQTLMRPTEKAEAHRSCAVKYGNLKRKLEQFSATKTNPDDWKEFSKEIMIEWCGIADNAPTTPQSLRKKVDKIIADQKIMTDPNI